MRGEIWCARSLYISTMHPCVAPSQASFLPHLLIPPLLVNTAIGFILFEVYTVTEARLSPPPPSPPPGAPTKDGSISAKRAPTFTPLGVVLIAGGLAGAAQCLVSAPLDNMRIILAGDLGSSSSSSARGKAHHGRAHTHATTISWRAIARAAILPFAPAVTRERLREDLRPPVSKRAGMGMGSAAGAEAGAGSTTATAKGNSAAARREKLKRWERRWRRWRGGVHGAGLVMSLCRDSVGEWPKARGSLCLCGEESLMFNSLTLPFLLCRLRGVLCHV